MTPEVITAFGQFGPLGLMIAYLVWREKDVSAKRREADVARAAADIELAKSLSALTVTIQHLDQRLK
ncbi:hypothetical protein [Sphingopyxis sp. PET50]|uniref:hypothetical protein n=1 Tax=Sphingopyxis sp. PET50 TaxID=2976533 RepID=UPI0021AF631A|nr:hypothetical protein [Sphingopyxis sp. PET50]